ncbi:NAD(P)/FAD-dependent oxidoreductase [uncultured Cetobacterium sp.]|uniref:dihydrolipoyl dehydrogenase family protein n=1 Tax=uncultured Cetobacterium sp. TaxID=527638 RepID=UPI0025D53DF6|nr:NAD(P)/FAD-dependent oxidoreductase [uncultured Cetobacterium sp.]
MYHTIVLGGGAGGLTTSIGLASAGKKVLLIEKENLGGECTWSGCIASKSFISATKTSKNLKEVLEKTLKNVHKVGDSELPHISNFKNIDLVIGKGSFVDKNSIIVNDTIYKGKNIVISTGSSPFIPNIKGLEKIDYLTNQNFFYIKDDYSSMIMIGAGIISLELAFPLKKLGIDVTILEKSNLFLPNMEDEIREFYSKRLKEEGIDLFLNCEEIEILSFDESNKKVLIKTNHKNFETEKVFISTGRVPNLKDLNLEKAGIEFNNKGIVVDKYMRTSSKNIFSIGDVASPLKFSHVAGYHGETVVRNLLFPYIMKSIDYSNIPWTIFGETEVSKVGLSEDEAKTKYKKIYTYNLDENNDRSLITFEKNFYLKVICDNKFNIVGATCIGERAGELIGFLQLMIGNKIKFYKAMKSIQSYPTYTYYIRNLSKKAYIDHLKSYLP